MGWHGGKAAPGRRASKVEEPVQGKYWTIFDNAAQGQRGRVRRPREGKRVGARVVMCAYSWVWGYMGTKA